MKKVVRGLLALVAVVFFAQVNDVQAAGVSPSDIEGARTISTSDAKALFDKGVLFIDVRKDSDWDAGRVPGAEHLELKKIFSEASLAELAGKDEQIVIYCNGEKCMRSSKACAKAVEWGFTNLHYYRDGFPAWKNANYPVE